jgi:hypothetical protein
MRAWRTMTTGVLGLALLACAQVASSQSEDVPMEEPPTEETVPPETVDIPPELKLHPVAPIQEGQPIQVDLSKGQIDPALQPLIDVVLQDMSAQMGLAPPDVEVLEARAVVWPDGSLGCPQPGMAYIQVQIEGALVRVRVGDKAYEYHSGGRRPPFLCTTPAPRTPPGEPPDVPPSDEPAPPPGGSAAV